MYRNFSAQAFFIWLLLSPSALNAHGFAHGTLIKAGNGAGWWTIEQTVRLSTQLTKQHVASYGPDAALWTNQRVTKGAFTTTNCACRLSFDENLTHDIICAPTQLFYSNIDRAWAPAYELVPGNSLLSDGPREVCVRDVSLIEESIKLYTVEVEDTHTFLVSELGIVAHNMMVPVAAVIGVSIPFGMECGGSLGTFFGPPGIIGGILIGGVIGCLVKTYNTNQIREYSLTFNPDTVRNYVLDKKDAGNDAQAPGKPTENDGFIPKKKWDGKKVRHRRGYGWPDAKGSIWIPSGPNGHGGLHWDVQHSNGDYDNVFPGGAIRGEK